MRDERNGPELISTVWQNLPESLMCHVRIPDLPMDKSVDTTLVRVSAGPRLCGPVAATPRHSRLNIRNEAISQPPCLCRSYQTKSDRPVSLKVSPQLRAHVLQCSRAGPTTRTACDAQTGGSSQVVSSLRSEKHMQH